MKRSLLISFVSAAALAAPTFATTVDFSAYSFGTTLGTSVTAGTGSSTAVLQDSGGATDFTFYQGFVNTGSTGTFSAVVQGSGGSSNYLQMQAVRDSGTTQPWSQVSTMTAFDTTVSGQAMSWSSSFLIDVKSGNGSIKTGLYAYNAMATSGVSGYYNLTQTQNVGTSVGLQAIFQGSNQIQIMRTGNAGTAEYWNGSVWGAGAGSFSWAEDVNYMITLTADTTTNLLTISVVNDDTDTIVVSATTDLGDQAASASAGGLRFSTGNLENNSTGGWTVNLNSVSADVIPEPSEYALMLGAVIVLGAWLRRRR